MPRLAITLTEWQRVLPGPGSPLAGQFLPREIRVQETALELSQRGMMGIQELRNGLELQATSFVGRIRLGDLEVTILPKLTGMPLLRLLRYAYGLRDLQLLPSASYSSTVAPFQDVVIRQLVWEAQELLQQGVRSEYLGIEENLTSPRGRIDVLRLARRGGVTTASLPCRHYPRELDCLPNQILLAGLRVASRLAVDLRLRSEVRTTSKVLDEQVSTVPLDHETWKRWRRNQSRLTRAYEPVVRLIQILSRSSTLSLEDGPREMRLPGFLFDMNRFFQRLLTRFLVDHLEGFEVRSEHRLQTILAYAPGWNPQRKPHPVPRPDIAVLRGGQVVMLVDAKYRDLWRESLPREMLYQVSLYAAAQSVDSTAIMLFPTLDEAATESRIELREPVHGRRRAMVICRPVDLNRLDALISAGRNVVASRARAEFARHLVFG